MYSKNVPNIDRTFIAKGSSRRKAEQAAAEQILKHWKLNDRIKSRTKRPIVALSL